MSLNTPQFASALSGKLDGVEAAREVAERARERLTPPVDLALVFLSSHHVSHAREIVDTLRAELEPRAVVGITAESVLAGKWEQERAPGLSLLAASLPGVEIRPFDLEELTAVALDAPDSRAHLRSATAMSDRLRATFLFVEPFSAPIVELLPALCKAREGLDAPILGGIASASAQPGGNVVILGDRVMTEGVAGFSLLGDLQIDTVVSQGSRPIGEPWVVTGAKKNVLTHLGGRPALQALNETVESLGERERESLGQRLLIGRVVDEYKERFGRGDFLIRNILGVDPDRGAIAVGDVIRVGQTVRFQMRDEAAASEDLALLLDAQKVHEPPAGALLVTCNGRGRRLFSKPHHDAGVVARAFAPQPAAEKSSGLGERIDAEDQGPIPLAGFFAAGEIGPVGRDSYIHGHTACLTIFRALGQESFATGSDR